MTLNRTILLSLVLAAGALTPAAALAKHGADDPAGDDRGGQGTVSGSGTTRATRAPSGSFSIERRLTNGAGPDTIGATATSPTGEVCTASATI